MQYMIIERYRPGCVNAIYQRFDEKGRMLPEGVQYINSWIDASVNTCFQLMQSESMEKLRQWISCWDDLVDFEVVPVISSEQARNRILPGA